MSESNSDYDKSGPTPLTLKEKIQADIIKQNFDSFTDWQAALKGEMEIASRSLRSQDRVNSILSMYFAGAAAMGLFLGTVLIFYDSYFTIGYKNELLLTIDQLAESSSASPIIAFMIVSWPIILLLGLAILSVLLALFIQSRGNLNFAKSFERLSRLRRESMVGASRSTAMDRVLEETVDNARSAFSLQLAISRTLFFIGVALFAFFVVSLISQGNFDLLTGMPIAGGSILSFLFAALTNPQRNIGGNLAYITQLEAILVGFTRQASIIEEHTYHVMDRYRFTDPEKSESAVLRCTSNLKEVLYSAIDLIQNNIHEIKLPSVTERFMEQQGWISEQRKSTESST